jgi:transcription-repair coupling factor (superfamily II helicase)
MPFSPAISRLLETLRHGGEVRAHVSGVVPDTLPHLAAFLRAETGRRILLVARDVPRAASLTDELRQLIDDGREWEQVLHLPRNALSPYIDVSVDARRTLEGLGTLSRVARVQAESSPGPGIVVTPATTLLSRLPTPTVLRAGTQYLKKGDGIDRELFVEVLLAAGYTRVSAVYEEGTFAVRGSLVDLFSPGMAHPVRVDFFGDEIEAISRFVLDTQMTTGRVDETVFFPATEVVDCSQVLSRSRNALLELADTQDLPSTRLSEIMDSLRSGDLPVGAHAFMPLLLGETASITDFFDPDEWLLLFDDLAAVDGTLEAQRQSDFRRYEAYRGMQRLALAPAELFVATESLDFARFTRVNVGLLDPEANFHFEVELPAALKPVEEGSDKISQFIETADRYSRAQLPVVLAAESEKEAQKLARRIMAGGLSARLEEGALTWSSLAAVRPFPGVRVFISALQYGVDAAHFGYFLATARELLDRKEIRRVKEETSAAHQEKMLALQEGDFVVHRDYGIGRFGGVERRLLGAGEYTCLKIEYAQEDALYVPIHNAGVIQRYVGSGKGGPRLDRLGSSSWENRVTKVRKAARKLAINLLELYAQREKAEGYAFTPGDDYFQEFEASFPYTETPDQQQAIEEVLVDMERPSPMDRLVCGDVGFGKTEVAIRAAFKAILDGRQVVVLVPTTVLAEQHRISFARRLGAYPVKVESLSRFKSRAEQNQVTRGLKDGTVDVVIGTHRLLGKDIGFKSLGLIIIDEEHRFGVGHKEKLKSLRTSVDVLSLTATPIPRTLHMALTGIRDLSVIQTAPVGRQDIETTITHFDPDFLAEAIRFEVGRGGQIFFLHNRVEDILTVEQQITMLVPGVRIIVAHGQMAEAGLEKAMVRFMNHEADVLLCTTIIESGLDLPLVNTLIVNNADRFGLAQLYQIRGRVGRSTRRAFAYFVVPPTAAMTQDARSRLATLAKFTAVGSGFQVANIDMEMRGAGNLLGGEQSGEVAAVGFDMYVHMLQEAVADLKAEEGMPVKVDCQVDFAVDADLPADYVADRHQRMVFYRRIAGAESLAVLEGLRDELKDRFGPLPAPADSLLDVAELKVRAQHLGLARVEGSAEAIKVDLSLAPDALLEGALALVREQVIPLTVRQPHALVARFETGRYATPLRAAGKLIALLEGASQSAGNDPA